MGSTSISPDGDDSNSGLTRSDPLRTIHVAMYKMQAPNTIYLANGTYSSSTTREYFPIEPINNLSIIGESESGVILAAGNHSPISVMKFINIDHATISNLTLTGGNASDGGGVHCTNSSPTLTNVTITGNYAHGGSGGGLRCTNSSPILTNVTISGNGCSYSGGGICCLSSHPILNNVTITGNSASTNGGGISLHFSNPILENVTISGNRAGRSGGGVNINRSSPALTNVTIIDNYAKENGSGIYCNDNSHPALINSILWNNSSEEVSLTSSWINIAYSNIDGGQDSIITDYATVYWDEGNIDADPLFVDSDNGNYSLQVGSPCIDAGTAWFVWEDDMLVNLSSDEYVGSAPDMGAHESSYTTVSVVKEHIIPESFGLLQNYPNPFNPTTTISYELPEQASVTLTVYDIRGQEVMRLQDTEKPPGNFQVLWNGLDQSGIPVSTGVYFCRLTAGSYTQTIKMVYLR